MRVTKFHPELAPPPLGKNFEEGTEPTGDGWVDHPSEFTNTKVYLYHPWKAPQGQTFEQSEQPEDPEWVTSRKLLPPMPDPAGPIHDEKRLHTMIQVAELLRARGFPRGSLREQLGRINSRECAPPLEAGILEEITQGETEIPAALAPSVAEEVGRELARRGVAIEDAYEVLRSISAKRCNHALSDEDLQMVCTRHF